MPCCWKQNLWAGMSLSVLPIIFVSRRTTHSVSPECLLYYFVVGGVRKVGTGIAEPLASEPLASCLWLFAMYNAVSTAQSAQHGQCTRLHSNISVKLLSEGGFQHLHVSCESVWHCETVADYLTHAS
jgi:hypothetical protein